MQSSMRYFGFAVGFGFALVWMTVGFGSAIVCAFVAGLGYGAVYVAERARADTRTTPRPADSMALMLEEFERDNEAHIEAADDATSPLAAEEASYGWPVRKPEVAHAETR